jgi:hypothetical protein
MMDGWYAREMGLLVLTSERILFPSRRSTGPTVLSVPLGELFAIEGSTRRISGTVLRVTTSSGTLTVDQILGAQGGMLAEEAREAIRGGAGQNVTRCRY